MTTPILPNLAGLGWPIPRTERWATNVQKSVSQKKTFIQLVSYPQHVWQISFNLLRSDAVNLEFQTMLGFFDQMAGQATTFLYQDQDDNQVAGQGIGEGDGVAASFQLTRAIGGFVEPIFAPNAVTAIYLNGVKQPLASYTVNAFASAAPGQIVFNVAPAAGVIVSADFSFYFPCNFTSDEMTFEKFMMNRYRVKKIEFESRK